ncbi:MAG: alkaline phosphatase [Candidatus Odinarchaeota archaeon]
MKLTISTCFKAIILACFILAFILPSSLVTPVTPKQNTSNTGRSIILMIGDGMGAEHVKLARWVEKGKEGQLNMETLPKWLNVTTHNADGGITDSAAAGTAMATGNKTNNGAIGKDSSGKDLENIIEIAGKREKSAGAITTVSVTHATPASFIAHVQNRYDESGIVKQITEDVNISVLMGGGRNAFDSIDLAKIRTLKNFTIVENRTELDGIQTGKILGLFAEIDFPEEKDRDRETIPSLAEMTAKSLKLLSQDPHGFFLMIEGGQIDFGAHRNDKAYTVLETIEFDKAVSVAAAYAREHPEVLLIVTADHETGGLKVGSDTLESIPPVFDGTDEENELLRIERVNNITVSWTSGSHTPAMVPFFGIGEPLESYTNYTTIDNTDIFKIMKNYYTSEPEYTTTTTTTITTTSGTTSRTTLGFEFFTLITTVMLVAYGKRRK